MPETATEPALVACPFCGASVEAHRCGSGLQCPACSHAYRDDGHVFAWDGEPGSGGVHAGRDWKALVRDQLNPLSSRLSPLSYFTARRLEGYYRRASADLELARSWANHYLSGIDLRSGDCVLDHGCGRGRHAALLSQLGLGLKICAQDVVPHRWWHELPNVLFQVCPPEAPRLPWMSSIFALVLDVQVVHYLPLPVLAQYAREVARVLRPGGTWSLLEANDGSYGAFLPRRFCGRLHPVGEVIRVLNEAGFDVQDLSYEGFYAPLFPRMVNFLRKQARPGPFDLSDYDSRLASLTPPSRRAYWLLRASRRAVQ